MRQQLSGATARGQLRTLRDALRSQLWPVPAVGTAVAVVLGVWLPYLDAMGDDSISGEIGRFLFGGDADAARTVLDAVASSLITVTSLTFSLTVVTLQLASGQFSPGCCGRSPATGSFTSRWPSSCPPSPTPSPCCAACARTTTDSRSSFPGLP